MENTTTVTLTKTAADYKLAAGETFLLRGRKNEKEPTKAYHHIIMSTSAKLPSLPALVTNNQQLLLALTALWEASVAKLLKDKAAPLTSGATITFALTPTDIITSILDTSTGERKAISGEEILAYCESYAFDALALLHGWSASQVSRVSTALRAYAAPTHRKTCDDATILSARLTPITSLLTGDDPELDADLLKVTAWLLAKLARDIAFIPDTTLADAI